MGDGWELQTTFGNSPAALVTFFNVEGALVNDVVEITLQGGGLFNFTSVDYRTISSSNSDYVSITGSLAGSTVGVLNLNVSTTTFTTVASTFGGNIDKLTITVTNEGSNALLLDNFEVSEVEANVPVPAALPLMAAGVAALGFAGYRRRA